MTRSIKFSKFWSKNAGFENLQTATKGDYTINIRIQKPKRRL